jgi:hypothetical protein
MNIHAARPFAGGVGVTALLFLCAPIVGGQSAATQKARPTGVSVAKTQTAVDKVAADRNVVLTDEAKRQIAVEIAREEAAAAPGRGDADQQRDARIRELFTKVDLSKTSADADRVSAVIVADRASQVRETLEKDVMILAKAAGLALPEDVRVMLVTDLEKQTAGLAASGLPIDLIKSKNAIFFDAIAQKLQGTPINQQTYGQMQAQIFQRFVKLRIESVPSGANVKMNNIELGSTDIPGHPLEPGKTYHFEFALAGYRASSRNHYIAAGGETDVITEPLQAEAGTADSGTAHDSGRLPPPGKAFPWLVVVLGVVLLVGLIYVVLRR